MNDIKNPAPFYTLKEAAKELNRILKVDYYDSKKLLSMALVYDIKLYIYAQGWDAQYVYQEVMTPEFDEYIKDEDYLTGYSEAHASKEETIQAIVTKTIESLMHGGCLLQLPLQAIKELRLNKICEINSGLNNFQEALYIEDAYSHQVENYTLGVCKIKDSQHPFLRAFLNLYDKRTVESIVDIKIYGVELEKPMEGYSPIPKPSNNTFIDYDDTKYLNHFIHRKEVLITHYQLSRIIEGALVIGIKEQQNTEELMKRNTTRKPQGKSRAKEYAQIAAKTLANFLWNQDKDNQIKIKEMAITVHAELYQTEHREQLPNHSVSLKDWIKDIAPEYAREAGRPKEM
ncbi:hypothetical protein [Acinetobacter towneri]|uniref:hypothetical protein n=1 Tax=Acinetobacter towneri TaxID=202956 RepID=UPI001F60AF71|nr:hypothetical protein [Acinetobacter towneri]UNT63901.1 hypothetical protein IHE37_09445 [Acinetobacter towneri]